MSARHALSVPIAEFRILGSTTFLGRAALALVLLVGVGCGPGRHERTTPRSEVSYEAGTSPADRDGDGLVDDDDQDYFEAGQAARRPPSSAAAEVCGDGEDNDADGDTDCDDVDCAVLPACRTDGPDDPREED